MQRYLFELCAHSGEGGIERRSKWISDAWLADEIARDPNLDRIVELPAEYVRDGVTYALPAEG